MHTTGKNNFLFLEPKSLEGASGNKKVSKKGYPIRSNNIMMVVCLPQEIQFSGDGGGVGNDSGGH